MSDRELLERAAKAAGVSGHWIERCPEDGYPTYTCGIGLSHWNILWNALTNDGDAFRLASRLELNVCFHAEGAEISNTCIFTDAAEGDRLQASRRAIVQAAAELDSLPS